MAGRRNSGRYVPSDDTSLMTKVLRRYRAQSFLEIGFGSGAVLRSVAERFILSVGTDILPLAEAMPGAEGSNLVLADRATCFKDGVFDLVAFNPPYLPSGTVVDAAVDGGKDGIEVPLAFLREAARVAKREGLILALLSDRADIPSFASACDAMGLCCSEVASERLFFEKISIFEVSRVGRTSLNYSSG